MYRHLLCGAALVATTATANAAVYRYDISLERTGITALRLEGFADGMPDPSIPGVGCVDISDGGDPSFSCLGAGTFNENTFGIDNFARYEPTLMGSLIIDDRFENSFVSPFELAPECSGSDFLCTYISTIFDLSAGPDSFSLFAGIVGAVDFRLGSDGLRYEDDAGYSFTLGNGSYINPGTGDVVTYRTTDLTITTIAPVPLPAGAMLLPTAIAGFAWYRRRTARRSQAR